MNENVTYYGKLVTHQPYDPGVGGAPPCMCIDAGVGVGQGNILELF